MKEFNVQVKRDIYFGRKYFTRARFVGYYTQLNLAISVKPVSILEVGLGDCTVSDYLRRAGYLITTCDFDKNLNPDVVADIRKLPFNDNSFDLVIACEVIEHVPFDDFEKIISELNRISKKNVLISFPYNRNFFEIELCIKNFFLKRIDKCVHFGIYLNNFFKKIDFDKNGQHYWEIGTKGYPLKIFTNIIEEKFNVIKSFSPYGDGSHFYFLLEKK
jgi:ubiquinone/menaquinone biosynthesis C-methylase UbiE